MGKSVPNENILKLRELSEKLCQTPSDEYRNIVKKLKNIVESGKDEIEKTTSSQTKIKCYESMCATITNLLNSVNFK
jgi:hypothetical protein